MQRPAPAGGGIFKDHFWQYYDALPTKFTRAVIFADTAQKTGQHNDYSVFQYWAIDLNGLIYLIDQIRGKWEAPDLKVQATAFWNKWQANPVGGITPSAFKIEDKSSGSSLIQDLRRTTNIPISGIPRDRDKVSRAHGAVPSIEAGNVLLPKHAPWLSDYLAEFASFTPLMTHAHDDQIDPTIDAIENLLLTGSVVDYGGIL
jgi:predicted phage terminase large subunit-like protein